MKNGLTSGSRAHVKITLEIGISDNWGPDATVAQIHKQAIESAYQKVRSILGSQARILDETVVTAILFDVK